MSTTDMLREYWSRMPITFAPRATTEELDAFENVNGVHLPKELRDYFVEVSGFAPPNEEDEQGFSFWPISRVMAVDKIDGGSWASPESAGCYVFADYFSLSWGYAFCVSPESKSAQVFIVGTADGHPVLIAENLSEFIELYLRNDSKLYPPQQSGT